LVASRPSNSSDALISIPKHKSINGCPKNADRRPKKPNHLIADRSITFYWPAYIVVQKRHSPGLPVMAGRDFKNSDGQPSSKKSLVESGYRTSILGPLTGARALSSCTSGISSAIRTTMPFSKNEDGVRRSPLFALLLAPIPSTWARAAPLLYPNCAARPIAATLVNGPGQTQIAARRRSGLGRRTGRRPGLRGIGRTRRQLFAPSSRPGNPCISTTERGIRPTTREPNAERFELGWARRIKHAAAARTRAYAKFRGAGLGLVGVWVYPRPLVVTIS
jgi:hypothetical protein